MPGTEQGHDEHYTLDLISRGLKIMQEWSNGKRSKASIAAEMAALRKEIREAIPESSKVGYSGKGPQGGV